MQAAASAVVGEHDFTSFAASDPDLSTRRAASSAGLTDDIALSSPASPQEADIAPDGPGNIRRIFASAFSTRQFEGGELLIYRVTGSGFLHHMVRNLVGTFLECGRGQIAPENILQILEMRSRSEAGATAPARGLFLESVEY